jgi:hypothetical protein
MPIAPIVAWESPGWPAQEGKKKMFVPRPRWLGVAHDDIGASPVKLSRLKHLSPGHLLLVAMTYFSKKTLEASSPQQSSRAAWQDNLLVNGTSAIGVII